MRAGFQLLHLLADIMRSRHFTNRVVLSVFGLAPLRIGGTERYCRELSLALNELGWNSVLAVEGNVNPVVQEYWHLPNVSIETLPSLTKGGMQTLIALNRLVRRYRPDIVHFHYTGFVTPLPWMARLSGARYVYLTNHSSYGEGFSPRRTKQPKRAIAKLMNAPVCGVVCPSEFGRRCLIETGILPEQSYSLIYNGTHPEELDNTRELSERFRKRYQIPDDRIIIMQVGQLIPEKGVLELLIAFKQAATIDCRLHLVLVGEGQAGQLYEDRVNEWGLSHRVTFTGLVEDTAASGIYEACDIFCLVSRWEELFGFVLIEAMTRSKPVVATRVGGIPEVVLDSKSGYLVERGNTDEIATRLLELSDKPHLREQMGRMGRERVAEHFDVRTNVRQIIDLYGIQ